MPIMEDLIKISHFFFAFVNVFITVKKIQYKEKTDVNQGNAVNIVPLVARRSAIIH